MITLIHDSTVAYVKKEPVFLLVFLISHSLGMKILAAGIATVLCVFGPRGHKGLTWLRSYFLFLFLILVVWTNMSMHAYIFNLRDTRMIYGIPIIFSLLYPIELYAAPWAYGALAKTGAITRRQKWCFGTFAVGTITLDYALSYPLDIDNIIEYYSPSTGGIYGFGRSVEM